MNQKKIMHNRLRMIKDEAFIRAPKINLQWLLLTFKERANRAAIGKTESYFVSLIYSLHNC